MLENGPESSALGAADDFGTVGVNDVVGVAAKEAKEVFRVWRRGVCVSCWGVGYRGFCRAAEATGGVAVSEELDEGGVYYCVEFRGVVSGWV